MAGLEIKAATISNIVTFQVDRQSIAEAKKAADDLRKHFSKIEDPKIRFKTQRQNRKKAKAAVDDSKHNASPKNTKEMQAQRAAEKAARQKIKDEKTLLKEQARIQKRNEVADLKMRSATLQMKGIAGKYGVDPAVQHSFAKFAREQTELFRSGQISSQKMNYEIRERIALMRREAALQAKITAETELQRKANARNYPGAARRIKGKEGSNMLLGGGGTLLGGAALATGSMMAFSRIREKGQQNLDLVRMSKLVSTNPNAVLAMTAWGKQHGVDSASVDKVTDNMKDVRERLGNTTTNATFKKGQWTGGDGGITTIMNQFGWNKQDIAKFQDNPLDFVQATVNEGQRRGMSQAQIGNLIESLGDDLMHYTNMFMDNGKQYDSMLQKLKDSGSTLSDEQIAQVNQYGDLTAALGRLTDAADNQMFLGFMKGFGDNAKELEDNTKLFADTAGMLGEGLGNTAKQLLGFAEQLSSVISDFTAGVKSRFPEWFSDSDKPAAQAMYDGAVGDSANGAAQWVSDNLGFDPRNTAGIINGWLGLGDGVNAGTAANQYDLSGASLRDSAMSSLGGGSNMPAYTLNPTFNLTVAPSVPLTIQSDTGRLADYIDFSARASQTSFEQELTLAINSSQSISR